MGMLDLADLTARKRDNQANYESENKSMPSLQLDQLDRESRVLFSETMTILEGWWDEKAGLLRQAPDATPLPGPDAVHMVRESAMYALGLLMRNQPGDKDRANRIINLVLANQIDEPGQPYHGTFYRYPEEPPPPARSLIWRDYDPNWREFIGNTLAIILDEFSAELEPGLEERLNKSIKLIIAGTLSRPLPASYTNIALMKAFMLVYAGDRINNPEWTNLGESLAEEIYALFSETGCFEEYNSPTYYGVDLKALGMWVTFSTSPRLRELGNRMEGLLWQEIARFYHAGLKNMSGPFDRSYGMDMRKYVTSVGISMRLGLGKELAALPDTNVAAKDFQAEHKNDLVSSIWAVAVGVRIPEEARAIFTNFSGERSVERLIQKSPQRVATAWLSENVMLGAEDASGIKPVWNQYHLATIHWRSTNNDVAWLKLMNFLPADARVEKNSLKIKSFVSPGLGGGERVFIFRVYTPDAPEGVKIEPDHWQFPGLSVHFETNAEGPFVSQNGLFTDIRFEANHKDGGFHIFFNLTVEAQPLS
jgi:hypothetical protein